MLEEQFSISIRFHGNSIGEFMAGAIKREVFLTVKYPDLKFKET